MNPRHQRQQLGLALGDLARRLEAAERRLAASEGRERELVERVNQFSASVALAWRKIESLERAGRRPALVVTATEPAPQRPATERKRIPLADAARALGTSSRFPTGDSWRRERHRQRIF